MKKIISIQLKKITLVASFFVFLAIGVQAQRTAIVDITALLENLDEYKKAQSSLDKTAAKWKQDIAQEYDKIKGLYNKYQAESVLMSDDMRSQKEQEIVDAEKRVREMQKSKFGPDGALFKKRQELVQPIQNKVYNAIAEYADEKGYDFIFDKSSSTGIIFSNPKFDKTDDVKAKLGLK